MIAPPLTPLCVVELASPDALITTGGATDIPPLLGRLVPGTGFTLSAVPF
ncbi:hypothetical protein BSIN_5402 [Burkholderia singularis]|uniref:Uncharacterized protein n=1 Tax=Burkholderia singularis TaxID=1503053 RepID=A0A238GYQ7_9BURK|nr:hypothetical protein BSIN_5402 [Burkholderia singularis]